MLEKKKQAKPKTACKTRAACVFDIYGQLSTRHYGILIPYAKVEWKRE